MTSMGQAPPAQLITVGHGNRSADAFVELLEQAGVEWLVDVRSYPRSRRVPWSARERLQERLGHAGIGYGWWGRAFGGKRRVTDRARWHHPALPDALAAFAEHMRSTRFEFACAELTAWAHEATLGLMCAEHEPAHCHRWLLADRLTLVDGLTVVHWWDRPDRYQCHSASASARHDADGHLRYDAGRTGDLLTCD